MALAEPRPILIYALHSGNLYGTERMALATARNLSSEFDCVIMAPDGPALEEGHRFGFRTIAFESARQFASALWPLLKGNRQIAFFATGVMHSLVCWAENLFWQKRVAHVQMVHGGAEERLSYGRKNHLNGRPVTMVAVSAYVRDRLIANGAATEQIVVIENFLGQERVENALQREPFQNPGTPKLIVVSRLDPEKHVDLLLEAIERNPDLRRFSTRIFGTGWAQEELHIRAKKSALPVEFIGFHYGINAQLQAADLLVHLCPTEPFGLAILEAMAASIPVLVPDEGGAGSLVVNGISGFHFRAGNTNDLAQKILAIDRLPAHALNDVVSRAHESLRTRFSEQARMADYRNLICRALT